MIIFYILIQWAPNPVDINDRARNVTLKFVSLSESLESFDSVAIPPI